MRRPPLPSAFALACVAVLMFPCTARASSMVLQSLDELSTKSDAVVRVTTLSTHAEWHQRVIVTIAHMRITDALLGSLVPGQEIDVATLGGTLDGLELRVPGAPHFATGEEDVLFLGTGTLADWQVTDLAQGKFEVVRDQAGRESLTRRDLEGEDLSFGGVAPARFTLTTLKQRVRGALRIER